MNEQIGFKCDAELWNRIHDEAKTRGISLSMFLREAVTSHLEMQETIDSRDLIKAVATIRSILDRRIRAVARDDTRDLCKYFEILGHITYNLIEKAKGSRDVTLPDEAFNLFEMIKTAKRY